MRSVLSYVVYFLGTAYSLTDLMMNLTVATGKDKEVYRDPTYSAVLIAVSLFIYLVSRDAAVIVRGKKFTDK